MHEIDYKEFHLKSLYIKQNTCSHVLWLKARAKAFQANQIVAIPLYVGKDKSDFSHTWSSQSNIPYGDLTYKGHYIFSLAPIIYGLRE